MRAASAFTQHLFPSRAAAVALAARVCAALRAHAEQLGAEGAVPVAGARVQPMNLLDISERMLRLALFRMRGAPAAEAEACLPDLLAAVGSRIGIAVTPVGLATATPGNMATLVATLASCMQGKMLETSGTQPILYTETNKPDAPALLWSSLSASTRAACARRLLPTGLLLSLDRLLRWSASHGGRRGTRYTPTSIIGAFGSIVPVALADLLGPLLGARLMQWRVQHQLQQRRQQQSGGMAAERERGAAGAGGSQARGSWRAHEELGMVVTALKLLRREEPAADEMPELLQPVAPQFALACSVAQLGCSDRGLVSLLPQLLECAGAPVAAAGTDAGSCGAAGVGGEAARDGAAPGDVDVCMVAQAVAACGAAALAALTQQLEQAAAWLRREAAEGEAGAPGSARRSLGGGGASSSSNISVAVGEDAARNLSALVVRTTNIAAALGSIIRNLPVEVLLAAAPQRALAALPPWLQLLQKHLRQPQLRGSQLAAAMEKAMREARQAIAECVVLLSADERLAEGCVPGWLWVEHSTGRGRGQAGVADAEELDLAALGAVQGPSYAAQQGPVLTIRAGTRAAMSFKAWRWADHRQQHRAEVVALARARAQELGLLDGWAWQAEVDAGGGLTLWPPRLLRLCGNPRCGNFGGACEAELKLQKCSRCCCVRYCGAACQKQHWPQHKEECGRWAASGS